MPRPLPQAPQAPQAHAFLMSLGASHDHGHRVGLTSVCSAHDLVIEAALAEAADTEQVALIEATCNQVNQFGGYTGMTPAHFAAKVRGIAACQGFSVDRLLLGGDHLGPNPWRNGPAVRAMELACAMTRAYAAAGFAKIHLDASMSCADDLNPLPAATIAARAAQLAFAAEEGASEAGHPAPAYVVGTEVPIPGGAAEALDHLVVSTPQSAAETLRLHRMAFAKLGLQEAFRRVIGLVVQPGLEFGQMTVIPFDPPAVHGLTEWRDQTGDVVFEAHSTDYQSAKALSALVAAGFGILKVGPGLTFALREALYGLDQIAGILAPGYDPGSLREQMESVMLSQPGHWQPYCQGSTLDRHVQRHFGYSDRIRYYWGEPAAVSAVGRLFGALEGQSLPETLISQFLPRQYRDVMDGSLAPNAKDLARAAIRTALAPYSQACTGGADGQAAA